MKNNKKGFTLVELLAVIVILAIIMVIAIPSVLTIMTSARVKAFSEYAAKVVSAAEKKYLSDTMIGDISGSSCYLYDITKSLGLDNTGDFKGYILVDASKHEKVYYYISMYNSDFELINFNYTDDYKDITDRIETIEESEKIDNDKIIYELSVISSNCTSVSYNFEGHGYGDSFEYDPDIEYSSPVEMTASYLIPGVEFNTALKMLSGNATKVCPDDPECGLYTDSTITSIAKTNATPPEGAVVVSTAASKYPTYVWLDGTTIYYKSDGTIYMNADSSEYFAYFPNVTSIDLSGFNTSTSTNMSGMFQGLTSLTSIDVSHFDTSNVTLMSSMFYDCEALTSLNLSNFDTSRVTNIGYMFAACTSLPSLDLSNFNTSNVIYMHYTFAGMAKLKSINLSSFDTSKVQYMISLFNTTASELQELDLSNFNTSNVLNMGAMFTGLSKLKTLNISNFNTSNVQDMSMMFYKCDSLDNIIGFEKITTENVMYMDSMFYHFQYSVANGHLDLSNFNTSKVTIMSAMFNGAFYNSKTLSFNLGNHFYTNKVTDMSTMFNTFAYKVPTINLDLGPNFDTSSVDNMEYMFQSVGRNSKGGTANINFGDKFVFKKSVKTTKMFTYFLQGFPNAEVHFPAANFSNIGVHSGNMFYGWPKTKKLYVKTTEDYNWLKSKYGSIFSDENLFLVE